MQSKCRIHAEPSRCDDYFDSLPDSLVLVIFNKLADVRSLGRCSVVSKRFNGLVPLVQDVCVKIDEVVTLDSGTDEALNLSSPMPRNIFSHMAKLMLSTILKLFHLPHNSNVRNKPLLPQLAHLSPAQVLKNFSDIRNLKIELPYGDVGIEDGVVLKWRAEFGSTLQSCWILGGTRTGRNQVVASEDNGSFPEAFYTNGGLKLRVVWAISSLISAATRHYLLGKVIKDHPTLRSLVLTDADGQGTLTMGIDQLKEFRENPLATAAASNRTQVPASNVKMRYASYLELPGGLGMHGATLVAIEPAMEGRKDAEAFVSGVFDGPFEHVAKALVKRRTYLLEMNGF